MGTARFSRSAKSDLLSIGAYTLQTWGQAQAERYLNSLEQCAKILADKPLLGRPCNWIRPGLRRFEKGRHVVYYRRLEDSIVVSRILHQRMSPDEHTFEIESPEA